MTTATTRKRTKRTPPSRDAAAILRQAESEAGFQKAVVDFARLRGWVSWHDNDPRKNERGLPDQILCRPPRIVFAELKVEEDERRPKRGTVRYEQRIWLWMLGECPGVETYLWRPSSWAQIKRVLM